MRKPLEFLENMPLGGCCPGLGGSGKRSPSPQNFHLVAPQTETAASWGGSGRYSLSWGMVGIFLGEDDLKFSANI